MYTAEQTLLERLKPEYLSTLTNHTEYPGIKSSAISVLKKYRYYTELPIGDAMNVCQVVLNESFLRLEQLAYLFNEQEYNINQN